ncbi:MAG: hypothetical protein KJO98_08350 [Rhodothermia bacterium]|nr:hypothetical protein [Rhodothermia bacterium]NNE34369.1 hypothetical protein [Rhodothermales bacterium]
MAATTSSMMATRSHTTVATAVDVRVRQIASHGMTLVVLVLTLAMVGAATDARAQIVDDVTEQTVQTSKSPARAAALSLLLPGLGQRYVNDGSWRGSATLFALADVAAWVGLARTVSVRNHRIDSYEALAAARADAIVDGKDRQFFLNLATYKSSDDYLETQLRNRAWDQLDYVSAREFQWEWASDGDFFRFRDLRNDAESLDRRSSILVATLVANRLLSAVFAVRAAGRSRAEARAAVSVHPPADSYRVPVVRFRLRL